jgi:hypothetical protein
MNNVNINENSYNIRKHTLSCSLRMLFMPSIRIEFHDILLLTGCPAQNGAAT